MTNNSVPILDLAVKTMDLLGTHRNMRLTEIVESLNKPKTTVYRVLKTLEDKKWLFYLKENNTYQISHCFLRYAKPISTSDLVNAFNMIVQKWQQKLPHTMQLAALEGLNSVFIAVKHPNNNIVPNTYIGKYGPIYATAAGKLFLANNNDLVDQLSDEDLIAKTPTTITDKKTLFLDLQQIKKNDYAVTNEEFAEGLCCLAVPVRDYKEDVQVVIDVCIPTKKITSKQLKEYVPLLQAMRDEFEQMI